MPEKQDLLKHKEMEMKVKILLPIIVIILLMVLIAGCSSYPSSSSTSAAPTSATPSASVASSQSAVNISNFAFSPQTLTVAKGATVTWTNNDSTTHTVTSDSGVWDSGDLAPGKTFNYTFNQTGTFPYHCNIHTYMTAKIVVQ